MASNNKGNADLASRVDKLIAENLVVIFSKLDCSFCASVKQLFSSLNVSYECLELDNMDEGPDIQAHLAKKTGQKTVPNVFIRGRHIGGADATHKLHKEGGLVALLQAKDHGYEYDIVVIGGGSGGLAASKEAGKLGKKVAVCDFVKPSPRGTSWGLGGTCVNVGCIPKKLMHQASLLGQGLRDATDFGWQLHPEGEKTKKKKSEEHRPKQLEHHQHNWKKLVDEVQNHIGSQNWAYKVALREKSVTYLNEYAEFVDAHTLRCVNKKGEERLVTADKFILATGSRPRYPGIPGDRELGITSDDLFSLPHSPGRTLLVGASYIALECAGFLAGLGLEVTVMVRSVLLRDFDQQMALKVGEYMEQHGVNFVMECVPTGLKQLEPGSPGMVQVTGKYKDGKAYTDDFNTVVFAIGRDACTASIGLDKIGVKLNPTDGKVLHAVDEQTSLPHVYAVGDVLADKPELTPVAVQAGRLLARRLCGVSTDLTDYENVCTTVFTPLEYGCCGLAEEEAIERYGAEDVEVYHSNFWPLEWTLAHRPENACYCKLVCVKSLNERVVGFHYLGPNAGEVTQGYGLGIRLGATKAHFDDLVGIHPTTAETFTTMEITKASGEDPAAKGC